MCRHVVRPVHVYVCADEATAPAFFVWEQARMPRASVDPAGICWAVVVRQVKDNIYPAMHLCSHLCVQRERVRARFYMCFYVCVWVVCLRSGEEVKGSISTMFVDSVGKHFKKHICKCWFRWGTFKNKIRRSVKCYLTAERHEKQLAAARKSHEINSAKQRINWRSHFLKQLPRRLSLQIAATSLYSLISCVCVQYHTFIASGAKQQLNILYETEYKSDGERGRMCSCFERKKKSFGQ